MSVDFDSIQWDRVCRLTFVPFLADSRCALIPAGDGLVLPSGEVLTGEDPMLDTGLRVLLVAAGFRRQGFHPFAVEGSHVYVWVRGRRRLSGVAAPRRDRPVEGPSRGGGPPL